MTVLFTDIVGSTALRTSRGDDAAQSSFDAHDSIVRREVGGRGGRVVKALGDGFMIVFSAVGPALGCAAAIQRAQAVHNGAHPHAAVSVRMGLNSGEVIHKPDDLQGVAVNAAARIRAKATGGEILISDVVRQLMAAAPTVPIRPRGRVQLKGFTEPWRLHELLWEQMPAPPDTPRSTPAVAARPAASSPNTTRPVRIGSEHAVAPGIERTLSRPVQSSAPLLERDAVLATLTEHLATASAGDGRLVMIHGEAGVGKTAVLDRFAVHTVELVPVLRGWCDPLSTPRPLGPWADVAPDLGAAVVAELDAESGTVNGLLRAVLAALGTGPRVLVFEDLHWADKATLDLIRLMVRRIARLPVLVVGSYRDDELGPRHPLRVLLGDIAGQSAVYRYPVEPLTRPGVAGLAAGRGLDVVELYRVTGGNPFFVTEVLGGGGEAIPGTVADAVAGRMARVSPAARRVAEVVAVIGNSAPSGVIADLVEDFALDELVESGVLRTFDGGVGFRHELARMAVLEALPEHVRVRLHARVLAALRADSAAQPDAALLAHHAEAAGDTTVVLEFASRAAQRAAASGAHREAAAQYARAEADRAELLERFAQASHMADQLTEALDALREAIELWASSGHPVREGSALRWLSGLSIPAGRLDEARRAGERAVRVLETVRPGPELAAAYMNVAELAVFDERGVAVTERYVQRAVELGEEFGCGQTVWQSRFALALSRYLSAEPEHDAAGWPEMERAVAGALDAGHIDTAAFMTMMQANYAPMRRDLARADAAYARLEALAQERDLYLYLRVASAQRCLALMHRGRWDEAAEAATMLLGRIGVPAFARVGPLLVQGLVRARRGDPDVHGPLDEALGGFGRCGFAAVTSAARAEAAWLDGDPDRAVREACRGLEASTPDSDPWATGELARWVAIAGGTPPTARAAEPFALELAGDWQAAARIWERLGCRYDAALARLAGDAPALLDALESFQALGARRAADHARARLRSLGVRAGLRGPRASTRAEPHGLTARQVEILDLVAEGLTDAQIAARLHLSVKTVNHHVAAVLAKLNVRSRSEAVRALTRP